MSCVIAGQEINENNKHRIFDINELQKIGIIVLDDIDRMQISRFLCKNYDEGTKIIKVFIFHLFNKTVLRFLLQHNSNSIYDSDKVLIILKNFYYTDIEKSRDFRKLQHIIACVNVDREETLNNIGNILFGFLCLLFNSNDLVVNELVDGSKLQI